MEVVANTPSNGAALEPPSLGRQRVNLHSPALLLCWPVPFPRCGSALTNDQRYINSRNRIAAVLRRAKETERWPEGGLRGRLPIEHVCACANPDSTLALHQLVPEHTAIQHRKPEGSRTSFSRVSTCITDRQLARSSSATVAASIISHHAHRCPLLAQTFQDAINRPC